MTPHLFPGSKIALGKDRTKKAPGRQQDLLYKNRHWLLLEAPPSHSLPLGNMGTEAAV